MKTILIAFVVIFWPFILPGQKVNSIVGLESGISATHSYWEHGTPEPDTYKLQNISHSSPFINLEFKQRLLRNLWMGIGVSACPVLYKRSTYYWNYPYLHKRTRLRGYGEWHFPLIISYSIANNLFLKRHPGDWHLEGGFITTWKNPHLSYNNGVIQSNDTLTYQYEHGEHISFRIPIGLSYSIHLPNNKIIKLKGLIGFGNKMQFREFVEPEKKLTVRSNASFLRLSLTYYFPINTKNIYSEPSDNPEYQQ